MAQLVGWSDMMLISDLLANLEHDVCHEYCTHPCLMMYGTHKEAIRVIKRFELALNMIALDSTNMTNEVSYTAELARKALEIDSEFNYCSIELGKYL